jgi:hypothetical protein
LFPQTPETALVDAIVQPYFFWKQLHCLRPKVQPFDIDFPIRTSCSHYQETEAVDMLLKTGVGHLIR